MTKCKLYLFIIASSYILINNTDSNASDVIPSPIIVKTIQIGKDIKLKAERERVSNITNNTNLPNVESIDSPASDLNEASWRDSISKIITNLVGGNILINEYLLPNQQTIIAHVFIENSGKLYLRDVYSSIYNPSLSEIMSDVFGSIHPLPPPPNNVDGNLHLKITLPTKRTYFGRPSQASDLGDSMTHLSTDLTSPPRPEPRPNYSPDIKAPTEAPITISIAADKSIYFNKERISRNEIDLSLRIASNSDKNRRVYLRADDSMAWSEVSKIISILSSLGYKNIGLVSAD